MVGAYGERETLSDLLGRFGHYAVVVTEQRVIVVAKIPDKRLQVALHGWQNCQLRCKVSTQMSSKSRGCHG